MRSRHKVCVGNSGRVVSRQAGVASKDEQEDGGVMRTRRSEGSAGPGIGKPARLGETPCHGASRRVESGSHRRIPLQQAGEGGSPREAATASTPPGTPLPAAGRGRMGPARSDPSLAQGNRTNSPLRSAWTSARCPRPVVGPLSESRAAVVLSLSCTFRCCHGNQAPRQARNR